MHATPHNIDSIGGTHPALTSPPTSLCLPDAEAEAMPAIKVGTLSSPRPMPWLGQLRVV